MAITSMDIEHLTLDVRGEKTMAMELKSCSIGKLQVMKCLLILGTIERERGHIYCLQTTQQMAIIKLKILQLFMLEMLSHKNKTSAMKCLWLAIITSTMSIIPLV